MLMTRCITVQGDITDAASNYSSRHFPANTGIHLQPKNTNTHVLFFSGPTFAPSLICGFTVKPLLQCNTTLRRLACGSVCWCQKRCLLCLHFFQAAVRPARLPCRWKATSFFFFFFFSRNSGEKKGFKVEILTPKTVNCDCLIKLLAV